MLDSSSSGKGEKTPQPRPARAQATPRDEEETTFAEYPSPYETLKREMEQTSHKTQTPARQKTTSSITPVHHPQSYPSATRQQHPDPLLHRVLDRIYRVQATPHTAQKRSEPTVARTQDPFDSSPFSSPAEAPQLRADIFGSPRTLRTPGISVQPGKGSRAVEGSARKTLFADELAGSDEDDTVDAMGGMSPPKTMQFHVPASRLLQTPAREASKRIVEDLLATAGLESATDETLDDKDWYEDEDSPSVVRVARTENDDF